MIVVVIRVSACLGFVAAECLFVCFSSCFCYSFIAIAILHAMILTLVKEYIIKIIT